MTILDYFLEEFPNTSFNFSSPTRGYGYQMFSRLVIGTGTGTVAESDTGLFNEYTRVTTAFGNSVDDSVLDTVGNELIYDVTDGYIWTNNSGSGVAVTEIGFAKADSGALSAKDLTRSDPTNPASSTITINVDDTEQLQVYLNRVWTVPFPVFSSVEITIGDGSGGAGVTGKTGVGDCDVYKGLYCTSAAQIGGLLNSLFNWTNNTAHDSGSVTWSYDTNNDSITRNAGYAPNSGTLSITDIQWEAYSATTQARKVKYTIPTSAGNAAWNAINIGSLSSYGYLIKFVNPTSITKTTLIQAEITLEVTWDRA